MNRLPGITIFRNLNGECSGQTGKCTILEGVELNLTNGVHLLHIQLDPHGAEGCSRIDVCLIDANEASLQIAIEQCCDAKTPIFVGSGCSDDSLGIAAGAGHAFDITAQIDLLTMLVRTGDRSGEQCNHNRYAQENC